jgi:hypothetical protein
MIEAQTNPVTFIEAKTRELFRRDESDKLLGPGELTRLRQEKRAHLVKAFPFNFRLGKNCKVEEIGEISDADEDWGDYQNSRRAGDEYSEARNAYTMLSIWQQAQCSSTGSSL